MATLEVSCSALPSPQKPSVHICVEQSESAVHGDPSDKPSSSGNHFWTRLCGSIVGKGVGDGVGAKLGAGVGCTVGFGVGIGVLSQYQPEQPA